MQQPTHFEPLFSSIETTRQNWGWFLALGVFLILLGLVAIGCSAFTTFFTIFLLSIVLMAAGIAKIIYAFWARNWRGFFLSLLLGILYGLAGFLCFIRPVQAASALTLIMGSVFVAGGLFKICASAVARFERWGWALFSGIVSLVLGILVLSEWPAISLWVIGLFIGIDLLFFGWTWVILALAAKPIAQK
ncbi:MAG TPA: HdeD family acid-resistance protein [Myxococcota bacterium]|nr:HdeD family acid-resistance protein [Myxococcota bacterium]